MSKTIEEMDLSELKENVCEFSDEELIAYLSGTRNNRLKPSPKKAPKKKKEKTEAEDMLVGLLSALGPDALEELAKMMEEE